MNDHTSLFFRGFICAIILFNLVGSGAVFGEDFHAGSDPKSLIVASARPTRSGTADNGSLISLPDNSGKSTKQTKSSNTTAATVQTSKYPRPNEMLQGVVYDLKRTKDLKPTDLIGGSVTNMEKPVDGNVFASITKPFVNGADSTWRNTTDNRGGIRYPYFDTNYYCLPSRLWNSYFFLQYTDNNDIPKLLHADTSLQGGGWIAIYSGYVVAPFSGMFRFVGFSDDSMLVRFNKDIVLDYGWYSLTMGVRLSSFSSNYVDLLRGRVSPTAEQKSKLQESPLFSKFKTDILPVECDEGNSHGLQKHGLQRGIPIKVQKGQVIPIEIILSEQGDGGFSSMLFVEQLDDKGKPYKTYPDKLPLFRTTAHLPSHPTLNWFPDFEDNGPIWKVVDSFGKPIPASKYAKQDVKIGFQLDDGIETKQQTVASATTTKPKMTAPAVNEEDELPGVLYDLKQTADGSPTYLMDLQGGKQFNRLRTTLSVWNLPDTADTESIMVPYLKRFVLSNWPHKTDSMGVPSYNEFNKFSRSTVTPYRSFFYQPRIPSEDAPKTFFNDSEVTGAGWVGINSGYVVAPFTGKFRFVGCGDDALVVRFNNQLVFDYGYHALSLGKKLDDSWDYKGILSGTAARTDPQNRLLLENPIYSQCKLETYFPSKFDDHGIAKGIPISVIKGRCYPIDILVTEIDGVGFKLALFIERLDSNGTPLKKNPAKLPLFRTSSQLPEHTAGRGGYDPVPDFDDDSPIWKIVNSKGKPIPSHKPPIIEEKQVAEEKKEAAVSKNESVAQEKQPAESTSQPQRDPNLKKVVSTMTRGNYTTQTVTEYNGDTTIETVTTTEVNGDTTTTTTTTTETKNGAVVKKTTTTTTTTAEKSSNNQANSEAPTVIQLPGGADMKMVKVEAGTFTMGALDGENREDEKPHEVTLKHDYFIGMTEVTQAQWKAVMNSNPSHTKGDNLPVETVSCDDAMAFCEKLNATGRAPSGWKFALPTEAQWEYAARGGKKSRGYKFSGSDDIDAVAWNGNNSGDILHPVGEKMANELGLYDMSGNVWEWCRDWYEPGYATDPELLNNNRGSERVDRGGSLWTGDKNGFGCRVACRHPRPGGNGSGRGNVGFRVALIQTEGLADASNQNKAENTDNKSSSGSNSTPKKNNPTYNPFGYTSPLMED